MEIATPRLFIAKFFRDIENCWPHEVVHPPEPSFRSPDEEAIVYSPTAPGQCGLPLALYHWGEGVRSLHVVSPTEVDFNLNLMTNSKTVVWVPVDGAFGDCRDGFVLQDRRGAVKAVFEPCFRDVPPGWPDWRGVLNARGVALLTHDGDPAWRFERARADNWPMVTLGARMIKIDEDRRNRGEYEEGWINPLVVGFRGAAAIPNFGVDSKPGRKNSTPIHKAISEAVDAGTWQLVPMLDDDATRRFIGWSAVRVISHQEDQEGESRTGSSLLASLFFPEKSVCLADLAALDMLGGCFKADCEREGGTVQWRWHLPINNLSASDMQLAYHLAQACGLLHAPLDKKLDKKAAEVFSWRWPEEPLLRAGEFVPLTNAGGEERASERLETVIHLLESASRKECEALGPDGPMLYPFAAALLVEGRKLVPSLAKRVFEPLSHTLSDHNGQSLLDVEALFSILVKLFFNPKSAVLARMTALRLVDIEPETFEGGWGKRWMDLFQSHGNGPADTLRTLLYPAGKPSDRATFRYGWWSSFWRHCVARRDEAGPFHLMGEDRVFTLDKSKLGRARLG